MSKNYFSSILMFWRVIFGVLQIVRLVREGGLASGGGSRLCFVFCLR